MDRRLTRTLAAGIALTLGIAALAIAKERPYVSTCALSAIAEASDCPDSPRLIANFGAKVVPKQLPKRDLAPVAIEMWGKVATTGGTHPSALREATIDFDRNLVIDAVGLPVCEGGERVPIEKACRGSIVGGGRASFEVAFPEQQRIRRQSRLTVYNDGVEDGVTTLFVIAHINVPGPSMIATRVQIKRISKGPYGLRAVAEIPAIAGGSGSLLDFKLRIKRFFDYKGSRQSYAMARCPNRPLKAALSALFRNEAHEPGVAPTTLISGVLFHPCVPTG